MAYAEINSLALDLGAHRAGSAIPVRPRANSPSCLGSVASAGLSVLRFGIMQAAGCDLAPPLWLGGGSAQPV
jgi:hypothetical protein